MGIAAVVSCGVALVILSAGVLLLCTGTKAYSATLGPDDWKTLTVDVGGTNHNISYKMTGGTLEKIVPYNDTVDNLDGVTSDNKINIKAFSNGSLTLSIPIASTPPNASGYDVVFLDDIPTGDFYNYQELCRELLTINFPKDTKTIEIVATVPASSSSNAATLTQRPTITANIMAAGQNFTLLAQTNADYWQFNFVQNEKRLHVDIEGPKGKQEGLLKITLPQRLLGPNYTILVNNKTSINFGYVYGKATDPANDLSILTVNYNGTLTKSIGIIGTTTIPEFGSSFSAVVMAAVIAGPSLQWLDLSEGAL